MSFKLTDKKKSKFIPDVIIKKNALRSYGGIFVFLNKRALYERGVVRPKNVVR